MARRFFKEADLKVLEREVREAEAKTSGEIVPLVVSQSGSYLWVHLACALAGLAVASLVLVFHHRGVLWSVSLDESLGWQAFGAALGAAVAFWSPVKRWLTPGAWARAQVHRECLASFIALGLPETRERTGVLIYLSILERRVEILADRGIHEKTGPGYWDEQIKTIIQGIVSGRAAEGLQKAIRQIGDRLSEGFPRRPDDRNELGDAVRFRSDD